MALSETHVISEVLDNEINIIGYDILRCDSNSTHTGGVVIYIKKEIKYVVMSKKFESKTWILSVKASFEKDLDLTVIYKSPAENSKLFFEILDKYFSECLHYGTDNVVVGDININVIRKTPIVKNYYNILREHGFKQIINDYTRFDKKNNSSSIIDHVIVNNNKVTYSIDKNEKITDHYIINLKYNSLCYMQATVNKRKMVKNYKKEVFLAKIKANESIQMYNYGNLYECLKNVMCSFVKNVDVSRKKKYEDKKVNELKKSKHIAYNKFMRTNDLIDLNIYDEINKNYKKELRNIKLISMQNELTKHRNDPKKLWATLKNMYKPGVKMIKSVIFNDVAIDDPKVIRDELNKFFVKSVESLVSKIPPSKNYDYLKYIIKPNQEFVLNTIEIDHLKNCVQFVKNKTFDDFVYGANMYDLMTDESLAQLLLNAINDCIVNAQIPEALKISLISPIPKVENPKNPEDFRPINNLPVMEKLLEKIILEQLKDFLETNNVITCAQHGFRAAHSTETALIALIDNIVQQIENKKIVITVFLDFKRAFETIDRKILIRKLEKYNFSSKALNWFENFLTNRKQVVKINDEYSNEIAVDLGVPQGSMIANILFIIYINDLVNVLSQCDTIMYADDTSITVSARTLNEAVELINKALENVSDWLKFNRIALNISKSKFMIFNSKGNYNAHLYIDNNEIERVEELKYLGVIVDDKLKFNKNGEHVLKKLNKKLGFLRRNGFKMNEFSRTLYYKSLVQPHLDYCSFIFNIMDKGWIDKFQIVQNKFIRAIKRSDNYNYQLIRKELKIVQISIRINVNALKTVNRLISKEMPSDLYDRIKRNRENRIRSLRYGNKFRLPSYLLINSQKTFFYDAISKYNDLQDYVLRHNLNNNNFIDNCIKFFSK